MVGHHADNLPRTHLRGLVSTRSFSCSPANRPAPWRWTSSLVGQAARRRRSLCACDAAAQVCRRPSCEPPTANAAPSLPSDPMRAGDHAARGPRRHVEPIAPNGDGPPPRAIPRASAVRTARLQSRGYRRPVRPDTRMAPVAWTPDAWTPDVRLTDWTRTSAQRTEDADRATTGVAGIRTSSRPATNRWAARPRPGRSLWWRSASHNGSAVTTTAQHRPRRRASAHCCPRMISGRGRANGEASSVMALGVAARSQGSLRWICEVCWEASLDEPLLDDSSAQAVLSSP
jgi:hypothetical protein